MLIKNIDKILIIHLGGVGDLLLSILALRALRRLYSQSHISILTVRRASEVIEGLAYFDQNIIFDFDLRKFRSYKIFFNVGELLKVIRFLFRLRQAKFDIAINMLPTLNLLSSLKITFIFFIIGAKFKAGRYSKYGFFLNKRIKDREGMHEVDNYLNLAKELGADVSEHQLELNIGIDDFKFVDSCLSFYGINTDDVLIGLNPGGDWPARRWPIENFAKLIDALSKKNFKIVITGSAYEIDLAKRLEQLCKDKILILTGKTNLRQLAALIKRCHLFISNDSAPVHMAAIVQTPLVAIFGAGDSLRFRPYMETHKYIILQKKVNCNPCLRRECKSLKCLKVITPEEVLEAAIQLLEKNAVRPKTL